jgi:hypothetical protein
VHEDLAADLARISAQDYPTDLDLHIDIFNSFQRLRDGHCVYFNLCYDCRLLALSFLYALLIRFSDVATYISYVPIPLVLLTNSDGSQNIHIAPEAFTVSSEAFPEEIDVWQKALPSGLKLQEVRLLRRRTPGSEVLTLLPSFPERLCLRSTAPIRGMRSTLMPPRSARSKPWAPVRLGG